MRIPQDTIDNIRNHVDIVDVISHYVPLTRKGKSFKCVCPFHDDHDPSLSISQEKQIFNCFVCGTGGNVFTFVQKYENISFVEAVLKVAEMADIHVEYDQKSFLPKEDPHLMALTKVNQAAIDFCAYELGSIDAKSIKQYLYGRGLSDQIITRFQLGYNPKENRLYTFLNAKEFSDQDIVSANLAWITPHGMRDVFSHRIMIPIHDANGKAVGFSARRVDESQDAKYINTSETDVYKKGKLLYNYHRAKEHAKRLGTIIIVEGAMDVLAFEKADIHHSIATLGTACTLEQMKLIRYLGVKVTLCYDGDKAGQNATYKFYQLAKKEGLSVEIIDNKYNLDPDEIIEAYGKDTLIALSKKTMSWIDFLFTYLKTRFDLDNYSDKKEYAKLIGDEIKSLNDDFEKTSYYSRLTQITGFDLSKDDKRQKLVYNKEKVIKQVIVHPMDGRVKAQMQIISQMLMSKMACEYYKSELGFLTDEVYDSLARYINDQYRKKDSIKIAELLDCIKEDNCKKVLLRISEWELADPMYNEKVLQEAILKIKGSLSQEQINRLMIEKDKIIDDNEKGKIADKIVILRREQGDKNG